MIENMLFDRNRTEFESGKAKEIWQFGTHIVPLAVSLADVQDAETREGCRQVYACIMEILTDMAVHTTEYTYGPRWYTGDYPAWMLKAAAPIKKHSEEYARFLEKMPQFGFVYDADTEGWSNERYPLFCDTFFRMVHLAKARKQNLGGYLARLDFRLFAEKIKLTMDDLLRPLSDREQEICLELHEYALASGMKVQMKDPYTFRYTYKKLYSLELLNNPFDIRVPYRLDNGKFVPDELERFLAEIDKEPDKEALVQYMKDAICVCNRCGGARDVHARCGRWVEFAGARRLTALCHPAVGRPRRGKNSAVWTPADIAMVKRMLDIRVRQIDACIGG